MKFLYSNSHGKNKNFSDNRLNVYLMREKYIKEYCFNKGWDYNKLKLSQLLEIIFSDGYIKIL